METLQACLCACPVKSVRNVLGLQENKYVLPDEALAKCSTVCQMQYCLQRQQQEPICEVKYISLGSGMACIAATSNGSRLTTLNVLLQQQVLLQKTGICH